MPTRAKWGLIALGLLAGCANRDADKEHSGADDQVDDGAANSDESASQGDSSEEADSSDPQHSDGTDGTEPMGDDAKYTYIWIANSTQGTVSKINTRTMIEEGRYTTRPDGAGDPSRTSVGLSGNVAIANRNGGITKIIANVEECVDQNGDGEVHTSKGASDVLAWGEDECIAWYVPMDYASQRAIAWTSSAGGPRQREVERLWVTGVKADDDIVHVHLLDGKTGKIVDSAQVSAMPGSTPRERAYGGAVDANNDFWFTNFGAGKLVRVAYEDLKVETWDKPQNSYGITVDPQGRPWICGLTVARFDPDAKTWSEVTLPSDMFSYVGGCMVDNKSRLWKDVANSLLFDGYSLVAIDTETLELVDRVAIPTHAHGISIDFDGNVWAVSGSALGPIPTGGTEAYRFNPDTRELKTVKGLVGAYTYSDMTGFALGSLKPLD